jgi:hypothetical protein
MSPQGATGIKRNRQGGQAGTPNAERRTPNVERRTSNVERRTSNVERRTSNVEVACRERASVVWVVEFAG